MHETSVIGAQGKPPATPRTGCARALICPQPHCYGDDMGTSAQTGNAIKVGAVGALGDDEALVVPRATAGTVDDIAVIYSDGQYFAIDNTCTHEQTSLAEGWIEAGCVECPLHSSNFRLSDGAALSLPAKQGVACHTIEVVDGDLMLTPNPDRLA